MTLDDSHRQPTESQATHKMPPKAVKTTPTAEATRNPSHPHKGHKDTVRPELPLSPTAAGTIVHRHWLGLPQWVIYRPWYHAGFTQAAEVTAWPGIEEQMPSTDVTRLGGGGGGQACPGYKEA